MEKCRLGHRGQLAARRAVMENGLNQGNVLNLWEMEGSAMVLKKKRRAAGSHAQVLIT